jgi:hypothetical protein
MFLTYVFSDFICPNWSFSFSADTILAGRRHVFLRSGIFTLPFACYTSLPTYSVVQDII